MKWRGIAVVVATLAVLEAPGKGRVMAAVPPDPDVLPQNSAGFLSVKVGPLLQGAAKPTTPSGAQPPAKPTLPPPPPEQQNAPARPNAGLDLKQAREEALAEQERLARQFSECKRQLVVLLRRAEKCGRPYEEDNAKVLGAILDRLDEKAVETRFAVVLEMLRDPTPLSLAQVTTLASYTAELAEAVRAPLGILMDGPHSQQVHRMLEGVEPLAKNAGEVLAAHKKVCTLGDDARIETARLAREQEKALASTKGLLGTIDKDRLIVGQNALRQASEEQQKALERFMKDDRAGAQANLANATRKLEQANKEIQLLRAQLQEEEREFGLENVRLRARWMADQQAEVLESLRRLQLVIPGNAGKKPSHAVLRKALELADQEREIARQAGMVLQILEMVDSRSANLDAFRGLQSEVKAMATQLESADLGAEIVEKLRKSHETLTKAAGNDGAGVGTKKRPLPEARFTAEENLCEKVQQVLELQRRIRLTVSKAGDALKGTITADQLAVLATRVEMADESLRAGAKVVRDALADFRRELKAVDPRNLPASGLEQLERSLLIPLEDAANRRTERALEALTRLREALPGQQGEPGERMEAARTAAASAAKELSSLEDSLASVAVDLGRGIDRNNLLRQLSAIWDGEQRQTRYFQDLKLKIQVEILDGLNKDK